MLTKSICLFTCMQIVMLPQFSWKIFKHKYFLVMSFTNKQCVSSPLLGRGGVGVWGRFLCFVSASPPVPWSCEWSFWSAVLYRWAELPVHSSPPTECGPASSGCCYFAWGQSSPSQSVPTGSEAVLKRKARFYYSMNTTVTVRAS